MPDPRTDLLNHASALVPGHGRPAPAPEVPLGQVQVGMADAGRGDAHERFAGARPFEPDLLDHQRHR